MTSPKPKPRLTAAQERCETCGELATQWDYDQLMCFCDADVQQPDFTVPLEAAEDLRAGKKGRSDG